MKKILLGLLLTIGFANAGKIYLGYTFDMDKSEIKDIKQVENTIDFPKPFTIYSDEYEQSFIFMEDKLKAIKINSTKNLKPAIEENIKNGFRLQKIIARDKYGKQKVNNVAELMNLIKKTSTEAQLFDAFIEANLLFRNGNNIIAMTIIAIIM